MNVCRFGILGPGKIANRFASAFQYVPQAKVYAVASREEEKAREFAHTHEVEKFYSSYEALLSDPAVDIVYVATPHPFHRDVTMLSLRYGKPVLCEKPLAMNYRQAHEMITLARESELFLMEGMWSRFFPAIHKTLEWIQSGAIGEIKYVHSDFCFSAPVNLTGRVYNPDLGGGAQLDVGVYPLFFALLLLGEPSEIKSFSQLTTTGVDATTSALLKYSGGAIAQVLSSVVTDSPKEALVMGTLGRIVLQSPWHKTQQASLQLNNGEVTNHPFPHSGNGFEFQIAEVARCMEAKKTESDLMPHRLSLLMAKVSDEIRRQGGVKYAMD